MTIKVGDKLPEGTLSEFIEVEGNGCSVGPNTFKVEDLTKGKKVVIFGLPGAFTPTCSLNHLPGYLENRDAILAKGVDDIVVVAVNDQHVMGAWANSTGGAGKLRFIADWDAAFTKALGMEIDLSAGTLGVRSKRYSMLVDDGVVKTLNVEESPGQATVSGAAAMIEQL